jgi:hypothetical protein
MHLLLGHARLNLSNLLLPKRLDGLIIHRRRRLTRVPKPLILTLIQHVFLEITINPRFVRVGKSTLLLEVSIPKVVAVT